MTSVTSSFKLNFLKQVIPCKLQMIAFSKLKKKKGFQRFGHLAWQICLIYPSCKERTERVEAKANLAKLTFSQESVESCFQLRKVFRAVISSSSSNAPLTWNEIAASTLEAA